MPKYGPHLQDIERKVQGKLTEIGLKPKYLFNAAKHQERFYTAPCTDKKGNKVIFKMRTEDYAETKEYFRREIRINKLFTEIYGKSGKLSLPQFIAGDAGNEPEWMVYEFIDGFEAGDFYNGLEKNNICKISLDSLVAAMKNMHEMSELARGNIKLVQEKYEDFERYYAKYCDRLAPFFTKAEIERGREILSSCQDLLEKKSRIITHGDFHPGNLIIKKDKSVAVIDWYDVHFNNVAFDIAFLVLEITDNDFRNKLLSQFVLDVAENEMEFWQLFRLDVLRLVPRKINVLHDALYMMNPVKADYYTKLTVQGVRKLELNLEFFRRALLDINFLDKENEDWNRLHERYTHTGA